MWVAIAGLGGAILAAVLGVLGVMVGQRMGSEQAREHWRRDEMLTAAADYIAATGRRYDARRQGTESGLVGLDGLRDREATARARLTLLGDNEVWLTLEALASRVQATSPQTTDADNQATIDALRDFNASVRRDVGLPDRPQGLARPTLGRAVERAD